MLCSGWVVRTLSSYHRLCKGLAGFTLTGAYVGQWAYQRISDTDHIAYCNSTLTTNAIITVRIPH